MKLFRKLSGLILIVAASTFAAEPTDASLANIHTGNVSTSSSFAFNQVLNSNSTAVSTLSLSTDVRYFVIDHLAVGGVFTYDHSSNANSNDVVWLGPGATYFFWTDGKLASKLAASYQFGLGSSMASGMFTTTLGLDYFITPSVDVGPTVAYRHTVGSSQIQSNDRIILGVSFGIYL